MGGTPEDPLVDEGSNNENVVLDSWRKHFVFVERNELQRETRSFYVSSEKLFF